MTVDFRSCIVSASNGETLVFPRASITNSSSVPRRGVYSRYNLATAFHVSLVAYFRAPGGHRPGEASDWPSQYSRTVYPDPTDIGSPSPQ